MKWVCKSCGEKASDGAPEDKELAKKAILIDYKGICPLCQGPLKPIKKR